MHRPPRSIPFAACLVAILFLVPLASADFHVYLECSPDAYALGDTVRFTWRNDTDSTVVAGNHPPYEIYTVDNVLVYVGELPWEYHLGPHSAVDLTWDQLDQADHPVPPGAYSVRIYYVFNDAPPGYVVSDDFLILGPASAPEGDPPGDAKTWGRVKSAFRRDRA